MANDPKQLAEELAKLPPAERYERLIDFPTTHTFKLIGWADQGFADDVRARLAGLGHDDVEISARYSSGARYVAITFDLRVETGARLVEIYELLKEVKGLQYLL